MRNFGHVEDGIVGSLTDYQLWGRIFLLSSKYWQALVAAVVMSLLVTGATLGLPYLLQQGIDHWITATSLEASSRLAGLTIVTIQYGVLVAVVFVSSFFQVILLEWIGQSIMHTIRQKLFNHLIRLDLSFINGQPTGRLVTRLTNDIQNMHEMFTSVMVTLFNDFLRIIGILVLLFWMNVKLAAFMSLFVPVSILLTFIFSKLARERFSAIRSQLAKLNGYLSETISGMTVIQLFGRHQATRKAFAVLSGEYIRRCLRQIKLFGAFMPLTEFLGSAAIGVILWYGGLQVIGEQLTLGELVAFLSYMRLFFQPLKELSQKYSIVQSAMASADRIFNLLDEKRKVVEPGKVLEIKHVQGSLNFDQVWFGYNYKEPILKGISLQIPAGKTLALVGTTGSGKSTMINLLLRFYDPDQGEITLDGHNIKELSSRSLRNHIGVVLQDVYLLQDTLEANIVMETGIKRERVEQILLQTGMKRFIQRLPQGLDTRIGGGGHELSTGEKQLLAIARVLCREPDILILDEATASIDTESENILEKAIDKGFRGRTSIIIAHRLSTIRRADLIAVVHNGEVVEYGNHDQLMVSKSYYYNFISMDQA